MSAVASPPFVETLSRDCQGRYSLGSIRIQPCELWSPLIPLPFSLYISKFCIREHINPPHTHFIHDQKLLNAALRDVRLASLMQWRRCTKEPGPTSNTGAPNRQPRGKACLTMLNFNLDHASQTKRILPNSITSRLAAAGLPYLLS